MKFSSYVLIVSLSVSSAFILAQQGGHSNEEEGRWLTDDWESDDWEMAPVNKHDAVESNWLTPLSTELSAQHSINDHGQTSLSRVELILNYHHGVMDNLYMGLDWKASYFLSQDDLVQQRADSDAYLHHKWQQAWLQYSEGNCVSKLGLQQLNWGVVDGTFAVDVINPFDLSEPLFTDFSDIKRSQPMMRLDCYVGAGQWQWFYNPSSVFTRLHHGRHPYGQVPNKSQWGGRYQVHGERFDWALMYAHLQSNEPVLTLQGWQGAQYHMLASSMSFALGNWLFNADVAFKDKINLFLSNDTTARWELALGIEYTSYRNHQFNLGAWSSFDESSHSNLSAETNWTLAWSKSYWHDDLALSALLNRDARQDFDSATVLAQYRVDDGWQLSGAYGYASATPLLNLPANRQLILGIQLLY